jgi:hypothetical protein
MRFQTMRRCSTAGPSKPVLPTEATRHFSKGAPEGFEAPKAPVNSPLASVSGESLPSSAASLGVSGLNISTGSHVGADGKYDPWAILGLKPGCSAHDVRLRYHELLKQYHPDHVESGNGDVLKVNEIDRAFQLITKAPNVDKRYRNLVSDTQHFYYNFLPEWMSKNVDEMPRWWTWLRWKLPAWYFVFSAGLLMFCIGRVAPTYPFFTLIVFICFGTDILLHTMMTPPALLLLLMKTALNQGSYDLAWFHSPKQFLRRELSY